MTPKTQITKAEVSKWEYIEVKLLHIKGNNKQNEKATYRTGENISKLYFC